VGDDKRTTGAAFPLASAESKTFQVGNGTLIIMAGTMQQFWKHEVPKTKEAVGERINLTFRLITRKEPH
jgi:hypothetical protein